MCVCVCVCVCRLRELLDGLQGLYRQAMQRDVSDTSAGQVRHTHTHTHTEASQHTAHTVVLPQMYLLQSLYAYTHVCVACLVLCGPLDVARLWRLVCVCVCVCVCVVSRDT